MTGEAMHVLGLSGGRDSAALAVWMRDHRPDIDVRYFFTDTGKELPEVYDYLGRLEGFLGKTIEMLNPGRDFDFWLAEYGHFLPSPRTRWCTRQLKIQPFQKWLKPHLDAGVEVHSYVAIRADERNRKGYVSTKPNITAVFPFVEDNIDHDAVLRILDDAGVGLPSYYEWRTRSGCYFCFYQRKAEWVGLADRHPELFEKAKQIEQKVLTEAGADGDSNFQDQAMRGRQYTWSGGETLGELIERREEIMERHTAAMERAARTRRNIPLIEVLNEALDSDDDSPMCTVCAL